MTTSPPVISYISPGSNVMMSEMSFATTRVSLGVAAWAAEPMKASGDVAARRAKSLRFNIVVVSLFQWGHKAQNRQVTQGILAGWFPSGRANPRELSGLAGRC